MLASILSSLSLLTMTIAIMNAQAGPASAEQAVQQQLVA
jgi:hypothetical protein